MNIGLFGGSFDPPHIAHLIFAEYAREYLSLDKVVFIPAYRSPFKENEQGNSAAIRCELAGLAISDNPHFELSTVEIDRAGTSYTVDTLRHFKTVYPGDTLFLLLGGDTFGALKDWREPEEIVRLANIAVALRPDAPQTLDGLPFHEHAAVIPMPQMDISSSDIRRRVKEGKSILYLVPWQVKTFIEYKALYR